MKYILSLLTALSLLFFTSCGGGESHDGEECCDAKTEGNATDAPEASGNYRYKSEF